MGGGGRSSQGSSKRREPKPWNIRQKLSNTCSKAFNYLFMFLMKMLLFFCLSVSVCPFLSPVLFPTTSFLYRKTLWIHWIASPSNSLALLLVALPSPLETPSQIPHPMTTSWVPSIPHPSPKDTAASIWHLRLYFFMQCQPVSDIVPGAGDTGTPEWARALPLKNSYFNRRQISQVSKCTRHC